MGHTVIDSGDTKAILKDAGVETEETEIKAETKSEIKPEAKTETAGEKDKKIDADQKPDPDDVEGEDGLTPRQKKELSAKMQKAIGKKHRQIKEAEEFAAAQYSERKLAEQRAQELERELQALRPKQPEKKEPEKPKREDFKDEATFVDAMINYGIEKRLAEKAIEDAKERQERAQAAIVEAAKGRIAKALELVPDFQEVTEAADVEVSRVVAGYMQKSEMFAELGYYLAKNPEVVVSLQKLPSDEQLVKIGKIESTLKPFGETIHKPSSDGAKPSEKDAEKASDKTGSSPSQARTAPVIKPLNGSGTAQEVSPRDMNIRETINDWQKKNRVNLGLRKRH